MTDKSLQVKRSRARGRYGESRLAKLVHGVVVGKSKAVQLLSGKWVKIDVQHPCDVLTELFAFESKYRRDCPKNLSKYMAQAIRNAPEGYIPVGVIKGEGEGVYYYVMTERDFLDLHVGGKDCKR